MSKITYNGVKDVPWHTYPSPEAKNAISDFFHKNPDTQKQKNKIVFDVMPEFESNPQSCLILSAGNKFSFPRSFLDAGLGDLILAKFIKNDDAVKFVKRGMVKDAWHFMEHEKWSRAKVVEALDKFEIIVDVAIMKLLGPDAIPNEGPARGSFTSQLPIKDIEPKKRPPNPPTR